MVKHTVLLLSSLGWLSFGTAIAQSGPGFLEITVNSNSDTVAPDETITLREAIAIANGALPLSELTESERAMVGTLYTTSLRGTQIGFDLPPGATTIELERELPAIAAPGITLDGTTQPGYDIETLEAGEIPVPLVAIAPAPGVEIARGVTVVADNTTIRGLSISGFINPSHPTRVDEYVDLITPGRVTAKVPPGNIFISHADPPEIRILRGWPEGDFPFDDDGEEDVPPQNVTIEYNQLGASGVRSAFGVYVFDGLGATIRNNRIGNHNGSGVITSVRANNLTISDNLIENNGFAGMPDAIRLEGVVEGTVVRGNRIENNAGSGIYVFKPNGAVEITENTIIDNGQRYKRAAIFLTGRGHQVTNNEIGNQPGPGVAVGVFPDGDRVAITSNQFANLDGLDIDLVAQQGTGVQDYQRGDGRNPLLGVDRRRDWGNVIAGFTGESFFTRERRRQVANYGINAPQFASREFFIAPSGRVTVMGKAEPGSEIEMYRIEEIAGTTASRPIATAPVDEEGNFETNLEGLEAGDRLSATATHPQYGTSEAAIAVEIRAIPGTNSREGGR
ncbi:MAG: right-handed parallel beta-helix repeat-containing protein [Cyanobacteriota bacterium]|nr:right-handed parallel beta-helix repeat-containing protein [Cyanobacteriota bacterium]